jgi:hypothetical protein
MKCAYRANDLERLSSINKTVLDPDEIEIEADLTDYEMDFYRVVEGVVQRKSQEDISAILQTRSDEDDLVALQKTATLGPYDLTNGLQNLINILVVKGVIAMTDLAPGVSDNITAISEAQTVISTKVQVQPGP